MISRIRSCLFLHPASKSCVKQHRNVKLTVAGMLLLPPTTWCHVARINSISGFKAKEVKAAAVEEEEKNVDWAVVVAFEVIQIEVLRPLVVQFVA